VKPGSITVIITTADQNKIADIALSKDFDNLWVGPAAVEKLLDQHLLADVAKKSSSATVGEAAVRKIVFQSLLVEVARHTKLASTSVCAIQKLTDQALLADIVKNDRDLWLRQNALKTIADQEIVTNVAKYDGDARMRAAAVERITDQVVLSYIAKNDKDEWGVRRMAISRITDRSLLAEIDKTNKEFRLFKADGWTPLILRVAKISFFESSGDASTDAPQHTYKTEFVGAETRYINWELTTEHEAPGGRMEFVIGETWTDPDGVEIAHQVMNCLIQADWTKSYRWDGWGNRAPGAAWKPGTYSVELRTGDQHIVIASFKVI